MEEKEVRPGGHHRIPEAPLLCDQIPLVTSGGLLGRHGENTIPVWARRVGLQVQGTFDIEFRHVHIRCHGTDRLKDFYGLVPLLLFVKLKPSVKVVDGFRFDDGGFPGSQFLMLSSEPVNEQFLHDEYQVSPST